ncbi:protein-arginine deiminase [Amycolatopsis xylanica]|uniref:Protein-arginine deiminase n=1 Tax=Amycolatopsis xylanica TaxID=589385 RepID=A0A1H3E5F9_9PSEU|nr:protein-arginine deiminase family protein [Amycolatopsis xylanica]SDX73129.1 protein-arginine deiminase [Amycolatopsis xylanica]
MRGRAVSLTLAGLLFTGVPALAAPPGAVLLADTNRNGSVDGADLAGKGRWTPQRGAIFLPNLDDDAKRCKVTEDDLKDYSIEVDLRLAACNDAQDDVVNGPLDLADLAPLRTLPRKASQDGTVSLGAGEGRYARLWIERGGSWTSLGEGGTLTAKELTDGAKLALEGRDVIRDKSAWNGVVTVTLKVSGSADSVQLRVAPLIMQSDLKAPRTVVTSKPPVETERGYPEFLGDLKKAMTAAKLPESALTRVTDYDEWFQDIFEPTTASMPGPGGQPQVLHVLLRSANLRTSDFSSGGGGSSLRAAGRLVFTTLRGPGVGVVQQFTGERDETVDDSLNSTGNYESLPPYRGHPLGRPLYGSVASRKPDPSFTRLIDSQYADPVVIDTSWLIVGHSDETTHVIPARTARGWTLMIADPRLAIEVMRKATKDGHGDAVLFDGTSEKKKPTIDEALADPVFLEQNETAAQHIDTQIAVLTRETGLTERELVRVPVLFEEVHLAQIDELVASGRIPPQTKAGLQKRTVPERVFGAHTAGIPNGISLGGGVFGAPDPHGPRVGGVDLFKRETERALTGIPLKVSWVEDWDFAHKWLGEVHCITNALREPTKADWWRA